MRATFVLFPYLLSVLCGGQVMSQVRKTQTITNYMNTAKNNEESIRYLYDQILNERRIEQLEIIVDETYVNEQGETGLAGFKKGITNVLMGFPDARWNVEHLVADDNRVMVKQTMTGTHTGVFQNIPPTGKKISNNGYVMYEFDHGKIVRHQILTDRLSFLQQLGVLPVDVGPAPRAKGSVVYFVDRFLIPQASLDEFISRMQYNRDFIRQLPGFIHDKVIVRQVDEDKVSLVTIAEWSSQQHLDNAKAVVQEEYKKLGFNPVDFLQRLNVTMQREQFMEFGTMFPETYQRSVR